MFPIIISLVIIFLVCYQAYLSEVKRHREIKLAPFRERENELQDQRMVSKARMWRWDRGSLGVILVTKTGEKHGNREYYGLLVGDWKERPDEDYVKVLNDWKEESFGIDPTTLSALAIHNDQPFWKGSIVLNFFNPRDTPPFNSKDLRGRQAAHVGFYIEKERQFNPQIKKWDLIEIIREEKE